MYGLEHIIYLNGLLCCHPGPFGCTCDETQYILLKLVVVLTCLWAAHLKQCTWDGHDEFIL